MIFNRNITLISLSFTFSIAKFEYLAKKQQFISITLNMLEKQTLLIAFSKISDKKYFSQKE